MDKLLLLTVTGITGVTSFAGLRLGLFGSNELLEVPKECDHVHFRSGIFYDNYIMRDDRENPVFIIEKYNLEQSHYEIKADTVFSFRPVKFIVDKNLHSVKIVDKP